MLKPKNKLFRWGPISACPLFMYFSIEPAFAPMKEIVGASYPESLIIFKDGKVTWLMDSEEFGVQSDLFIQNTVLNDSKFAEYLALWKECTDHLVRKIGEYQNLVFSSLSNDELSQKYRDFYKIYYAWFTVTISLELASSGLEPMLGTRLRAYFDDSDSKDYQEAFSILTSPLKLSFYRREEQSLLKILLLPAQEQEDALKEHQQNYHWILNSYAKATVLDIEYFTKELQKFKKEDYKKTLEEIDNFVKDTKEKKEEIFSRLRMKDEDKKIVRTIQIFSELQDERKENNFKAEYFLELFVKEFAKRTKGSVNNLKLLLPSELSSVLKDVDNHKLDQRRICVAFECNDHLIKEYIGEEAQRISNKYLEVKNVDGGIIHGRVASVGKSMYFRGIAKVVLSIDEIDKVNKGDVIVTGMTSPDFVIGMKKAGAIITDVGGVLSHAAIVSREFGIPCIVGTEVATKVIKDGDTVELHCGRGTIKIVKHE